VLVLGFAAGSGSVEHAFAMIGVRCCSFDIRALVETFGAQHANRPIDLTKAIYDVAKDAFATDGRYMLQIGATFADLECTTQGGLQAHKHRAIVPCSKQQKAAHPAHGKPKPGPAGVDAADLDVQLHNALPFLDRLQTERDQAHALLASGQPEAASAPATMVGPSPPLCADPTEKLITTDYDSDTDLPIESTADPALNRHENSVHLPMMESGVRGCRGDD
jgi:hypothetical protein